MTKEMKKYAGLLAIHTAHSLFETLKKLVPPTYTADEQTAVAIFALRLALHATEESSKRHGFDPSILPNVASELAPAIARVDKEDPPALDPRLN